MENHHLFDIKARFEETINQLMLKGKINTLRDEVLAIANEAFTNHKDVVAKLRSKYDSEIERVKKQADDRVNSLSAEYEKYRIQLTEDFEKLKKNVTTKANKQRKDAAARGNRFKSQYDNLLNAIDGVLPGAKHLVENRAIPEKEKQRRLKKLDAQIEIQGHEVDKYVGDYNSKYKTNDYYEGYGKEQKILDVLHKRKQKLKAKVTYDDDIDTNPAGEETPQQRENLKQT
jgi:hypothetical protein